MKQLTIIQHTSAEYLGAMEDHFEGRRIGFRYHRPFTESGRVPEFEEVGDGLVLLGGGPWGGAGERNVPSLQEEIKLTRACFMSGIPILAFGLGSQILALATDGGVKNTELEFSCNRAIRVKQDALFGFMPDSFPNPVYMRDWPIPPDFAEILAEDEKGRVAVFQIGKNILGFSAHIGFKRAIAEDLIMEFEENPENPAPVLDLIGQKQNEIEDALVPLMTGIIKMTGWMEKP